jgi:hypothetical protein
MLMASRRLIFALESCKTATVAVGAWNSLSATSFTMIVERATRSSSTSTRIGEDRRRAAAAERFADPLRPARTPANPDWTCFQNNARDMMLTSLWIGRKHGK